MEKYDPLAINYKMDTLEDILSIPVPTEKFELPDDFMDSIEYVLQRKATEFKKEGDMECAIACLEKAVEIIPFSPMPYPDCFERLEKYLKLNNQWDEAEEVSLEGDKQEKNFQNEFKNKVLSDAAKLGTDLLEASYHEPASAKEAMYRGRVFSISGSDFVEMFVGVGASRVRDLFRQAKEKAPCIIFIDEIDAVGRARGKNPSMGGNDERENTLNQLLTEMDGFGSNSGVIILAATNRADILDKALLRAGRFDRQIHVDLPDLNERKEVFGVHLKPLKLDESVDLDLLARQTPGFSGADIANVCNEAALIAARHGKNAVGKQDFLDAVDRIIGGLEKKTKIMTAEEKRTIALHEAGHATLSWFLEHANPLIKVTIVPRGRALGAAWYLPEERQITTKEQMLDEMCATLGGRAAEELFTGHISTGAMNDLERVTKQSYGMIAYAGMSEKLPNLCYYSNDEYSFSKPYSERTAELIDEEVKRMINEQYDRAKAILSEHKDGHNELARLLVEKEVIFAEDVERIFGKRPWTSRSEEIMALEATVKPVEVTEDFEEKKSSDSEEKEKEKKEA